MRPTAPRRVLVPLALALAVHVPPASLAAQPPRPVSVGARVRVLAPPPSGWREGRVVALDGRQLVLGRAGSQRPGSLPDTIPASAVQRIEVRESGGAVRAVGFGLVGGLAGAAIGGLIGAAATDCTGCEDPGWGALIGVPVGGLLGLVSGAVLGARTGGRWVPARLPASGAR